MTQTQITIAAASLLATLSLWLMLPRGAGRGRWLGVVLGFVALGLFGALGWRPGSGASQWLFWVISAVTLLSAGAAVTLRSPVYCAVWFALSLLGTAGLFLFQGAQFLAVATIIVYAGAILVTFLFVLMLAQADRRAYYDRVCWEPLLSALAGAALVGILTMALVGSSLDKAQPPPSERIVDNVLSSNHVANLGAQLFSRYLIPVEVAGTLLLVALVGAIAMVSHIDDSRSAADSTRDGRPGPPSSQRMKEPAHD
jgi:NADH-quinone oxidoreductase subunit J